MKNWYRKILNSGIDASFSDLLNEQIKALNKIAVSVIIMLLVSSTITFAFIPEHRLFVSTIFLIEFLILVMVLALSNVQRITMAKSVFTFNITFMVLLLVGYYGIISNFHYIGIISFISFLFLFRNGTKKDFAIVYTNMALFLIGVIVLDLTDFCVVELEGEGLKRIKFLAFVSSIFVVVVTGSMLLRWHRSNHEKFYKNFQELTQQSKFLQTISSNLDVAFFKSNPAVGFEFINESFAKMFGFESIEEMMVVSPETLYFNVEDRIALIDKLRRERLVHNALIRYKRRDGELFYGRLSCNVIVEQSQDRLVGVITDVTVQHHQDELLRQNEMQLKEAQRIAKLGNFQLNEDTMNMHWSEETFRLHGYPIASVAPSIVELIEHFPLLDLTDFRTYFEACKLTGIPTEFGGWYIDPAGIKKYLQFRARYVELEQKDSYWSGTVQDITERKEMEEELEGTSRFYEAILNNTPLEIALLDSNLNYTYISEESIKNKDTRGWLIGKNDFDYCKYKHIPIEVAALREKHFREALNTNSVVRWEEEMVDQ